MGAGFARQVAEGEQRTRWRPHRAYSLSSSILLGAVPVAPKVPASHSAQSTLLVSAPLSVFALPKEACPGQGAREARREETDESLMSLPHLQLTSHLALGKVLYLTRPLDMPWGDT